MGRVLLVCCVKQKRDRPAPATEVMRRASEREPEPATP